MNTKVTVGVVSGLLALMLLVVASRRKGAEIAARLQSSEQTVEALEQQLGELSQTVGRQSRLINQLRAEPLGQAEGEPAPVPPGTDDLWLALEPLVEQHLEDREARKRDEQRQRHEEAMARSHERRNQQLAKQLGLNPFQSEQLAKVRDEFQSKRRDAMMPADGEPLDSKRMKEILQRLKGEERTRLAGFLTPEQLGQYNNRSSRSVQVMSTSSDGDISGEAFNLSIKMTPGAVGTSSVQMTVGDDVSEAFVSEDSDFFPEDEVSGEIIFDNDELPLPPFPPPPYPLPPPPE
ncbi:MAG: hypothetical protein H8E20_11975 [Verrucomicrobia bacterium]|nr:hypothetical protein [Verrucomicrobiota bacterium]